MNSLKSGFEAIALTVARLKLCKCDWSYGRELGLPMHNSGANRVPVPVDVAELGDGQYLG